MKISALHIEDYLNQFKGFLASSEATDKKGIVYTWKLENSFSRVKGKSSIIYIGHTIKTFRDRYNNSKCLSIEKLYFERYYKHMIELYGPLTIEVIQTAKPERCEWEKLMAYNEAHKEYPPLNRSIPNEPN